MSGTRKGAYLAAACVTSIGAVIGLGYLGSWVTAFHQRDWWAEWTLTICVGGCVVFLYAAIASGVHAYDAFDRQSA